jgi:hypothetical protein
MQIQDIQVLCDVYCKWRDVQPVYRCWVNDELFAERTWAWNDVYLEEQLQIHAPAGQYTVRFELVNSNGAGLKVRNIRVLSGPGRMVSENCVEIYHETA